MYYVLKLRLSYNSTANPKNINAFAIFPFAGIFVGASIKNAGSVLNTHAHLGRSVLPVTTMINNNMSKTKSPTYAIAAGDVLLKKSMITLSASSVLPSLT